jgi:Ca2+-binding EF-hand superfamily protein
MISGISGASSMWSQMSVRSMRPSKEQMFSKMDQNSDGGIDKAEMQTVLGKMAEQSGQTVKVDDLFSQHDSDGNGKLSQDETNTAMESLLKGAPQQGGMMQAGMRSGAMPPPPPDFAQMFKDADTDSDGSIAKTEMQTVADKIKGRSGQTLSVEDLFSQYDSDSDGKLSETEAKEALASLFDALKPDTATMKKLFYESSSYKPVDVIA